jgi:hypothetical protein
MPVASAVSQRPSFEQRLRVTFHITNDDSVHNICSIAQPSNFIRNDSIGFMFWRQEYAIVRRISMNGMLLRSAYLWANVLLCFVQSSNYLSLEAALSTCRMIRKHVSYGGLYGCEMLRIPHCLDNQLTVNCEILATCSSTGRGGLYGCEMLRIPHCLDNRIKDGCQGCQPYASTALYSPGTLFFCFWYSFLLTAEWTPGPSAAWMIR